MSSRTRIKRRERKQPEKLEEVTPAATRKRKSPVPASNLRHRLFAISPDVNKETSSNTKEKLCEKAAVVTPKKEGASRNGDDGENDDIVCCRGSAAYAVLKQINHDEPDEGILFSEIPESSQSNLNQEWSLDAAVRDDLVKPVPLAIPVFHHSRESQPQRAQPVTIRRNEVLPQEKGFAIGDEVLVYQCNRYIGSGIIIDADLEESSLFVVKSRVRESTWQVPSSDIIHATSVTAQKGSYSRKRIRDTFLDCLADELRNQVDNGKRMDLSPSVSISTLAKSIASDAFRKKRVQKID